MVTESKESRLRSDDFGKDIASVQALLSKQVSITQNPYHIKLMFINCNSLHLQETSEAGLATFQQEGIGGLTSMKEKLVEMKHPQSRQIQDRHSDVLRR